MFNQPLAEFALELPRVDAYHKTTIAKITRMLLTLKAQLLMGVRLHSMQNVCVTKVFL